MLILLIVLELHTHERWYRYMCARHCEERQRRGNLLFILLDCHVSPRLPRNDAFLVLSSTPMKDLVKSYDLQWVKYCYIGCEFKSRHSEGPRAGPLSDDF